MKILGQLGLNPILWVMVIAMIATPLYTYHMAVSKGEEPPYPHATITSTATHYPQDIVFRFVMLFNSSFLALTFFVVFRWIESEALRVNFPNPPKYQFYLAEGSILCYSITIGTIDGKGTGKLHGPCAVTFFIVWLATIISMTVYLTKLRKWDCTTIGKRSLRIKQLLSLYISGLWIWCIYHIIKEQKQGRNKQDIYVVII